MRLRRDSADHERTEKVRMEDAVMRNIRMSGPFLFICWTFMLKIRAARDGGMKTRTSATTTTN